MTTNTLEPTTVQGAPRGVVEDAWNTLNRRYAIGTALLAGALLLLWVLGMGPGTHRGAGVPGAGQGMVPGATNGPAGGQPASAPSAAGTASGGSGPAPGSASAAPAGAPGGVPAAGAGASTTATVTTAPGGATAGAVSAGAASPSAAARPNAAGANGTGSASAAAGPATTPGAAATGPAPVAGAPVARLFFEPDQAWPSGAVGPALAPVLARLKAEPDTKALVSGYHDRRGSAERNAELAQRRAQAIRRVLVREGIAADRIVLAKPQQTQGSGPDREARRVEVTIAR
jgi:K(+)-stimulated pyrophosphate-energized sodium pump